MTKNARFATASLDVAAVLYVTMGTCMLLFPLLPIALSKQKVPFDFVMGVIWLLEIGIFLFMLTLAAIVEIVAWGIRRETMWGWIAGVLAFFCFIPSCFLPLE